MVPCGAWRHQEPSVRHVMNCTRPAFAPLCARAARGQAELGA